MVFTASASTTNLKHYLRRNGFLSHNLVISSLTYSTFVFLPKTAATTNDQFVFMVARFASSITSVIMGAQEFGVPRPVSLVFSFLFLIDTNCVPSPQPPVAASAGQRHVSVSIPSAQLFIFSIPSQSRMPSQLPTAAKSKSLEREVSTEAPKDADRNRQHERKATSSGLALSYYEF